MAGNSFIALLTMYRPVSFIVGLVFLPLLTPKVLADDPLLTEAKWNELSVAWQYRVTKPARYP
jgi:hypothetical protein